MKDADEVPDKQVILEKPQKDYHAKYLDSLSLAKSGFERSIVSCSKKMYILPYSNDEDEYEEWPEECPALVDDSSDDNDEYTSTDEEFELRAKLFISEYRKRYAAANSELYSVVQSRMKECRQRPDVIRYEALLNIPSAVLGVIVVTNLIFISPYSGRVLTHGVLLTGTMAFSLGKWLRLGSCGQLGINQLLMSNQVQIQYIYSKETTTPSWAHGQSYLIAGNKMLLGKEARDIFLDEDGHMDKLADSIEMAIRGLPNGEICVRHSNTELPHTVFVQVSRGVPITLTASDLTYLMTIGSFTEEVV